MKRAALLLLAIAVPAFADRFNVTLDGKPVSRAQVCASRAGDLASPMTRFFTGTATFCLDADGDVRLPGGTWNVFARRGTELISDSVVLAIGNGSKVHDLALVPAASVEHDDQPLYVYVPATSAVIPVKDIVPAARVVPLIVKAGRVMAIGTEVTPRAGKTICFDFPEEKGSVIVPVTVQGTTRPLPQVTLAGASQLADSSLLFFRGVPAGTQTVELSGQRWVTVRDSVRLDARAIAVARPLIARPKSDLHVHWSVQADLPKNIDCDGKTSDAKALVLTLFDCTARCAEVARRELPNGVAKGVVEFTGIGAGSYQLLAGPLRKNITVGDGADVDFVIRYATFFGRVTRGGKPLHARLFGTATDGSGDYTAALVALPKSGAPVELTPCEGGGAIKVVPDAPPDDHARFDIDVPDNRLTIRVIDADSRAPVEKAFVSMAALEEGHDQAAHLAGPAGMTNAEGQLVIESAVANRRLHICAWRTDYENACSDRFQLGGETDKTVELALSKSSARRGRVVLDGPQQVASVAWYAPDGRMTEIAQVRDDGTFTYQRTHAPVEIVAYFSVNQPFIVMRQPPVADGDVFEIRPPYGARVRTFQVTARESGMLAIALGDIIVPTEALRLHMSRHGVQPNVAPGWTTTVPDVVESAPIRVVFIPMSFVASHDVRGVDVAMLPEANTLPQQALGERARVEFP